MNRSTRRFQPTVLALGIAVPAILVATASLMRVDAQPQAPAPTGAAGKYYKNIKVLKDMPADRLIPTMRDWNAALGVKCDFCHVIAENHTGFEKDDKPTKNAARGMVTMAVDLNKKKIVNNRVTCYLCHHGRPDPESHPGAEAPRRGPGR